ncbi:hypothetical protein GQ600_8225 [Phytophthora cactorum]|nr:hypothetical protein GQ600_11791 [Phytophthora cactorum]KAF1774898.1 hypothetical protein GQ600_8225 [Phytophthora cactorum]
MRQSFLVLVLVLAFAACVQGLTNNENAALSVNHETTIAKRRGEGAMTKVSEMLKGAFSPITKLFGTNTASKVQSLQKDAKLVNSIKSDKKLQQLGTIVSKNPGALTEKKVGKIGEFVARLKKIEFVGDVKGMRIAYGILFLGIFGILVTGYFITRNVQNSYIPSDSK